MTKEERKKLMEKAKMNEQEKVLSGITLYPKLKDVLQDEELVCVFRPLLTVKRFVSGKEFFINLEYNLKNSYDIREDMACFGMAAYSFMRDKDMVFALADAENHRVYMLEYFS